MKIIVLNDNRCSNNNLKCEHGISLYIECFGKKILFDAGQTDVFINNAKQLNVDLTSLDYIVVSHGDFDHGNGLKFLKLNKKIPLFIHPDFVKTRISKRTGNNNGLNQTKEELSKQFDLIESKMPTFITKEIIFSGQIERKNNFELEDNLPATDENGKTYMFFDDTSLIIKTNKGLIIFSGCGHSGICNIIEYAKKITNDSMVLAVIGGFHLKKVNEQTKKTINYMKENNVSNILLAHCTSDEVCKEFKNKLGERVSIIETGNVYEF